MRRTLNHYKLVEWVCWSKFQFICVNNVHILNIIYQKTVQRQGISGRTGGILGNMPPNTSCSCYCTLSSPIKRSKTSLVCPLFLSLFTSWNTNTIKSVLKKVQNWPAVTVEGYNSRQDRNNGNQLATWDRRSSHYSAWIRKNQLHEEALYISACEPVVFCQRICLQSLR